MLMFILDICPSGKGSVAVAAGGSDGCGFAACGLSERGYRDTHNSGHVVLSESSQLELKRLEEDDQ